MKYVYHGAGNTASIHYMLTISLYIIITVKPGAIY